MTNFGKSFINRLVDLRIDDAFCGRMGRGLIKKRFDCPRGANS